MNGSILPHICYLLGWLWIFPSWILLLKPILTSLTSSFLTMAPMHSVPLNKMAALIPPPPVDVGVSNSTDSLLPPFLRLNLKIKHEHKGQYHKGFLGQRNGCYHFVFKSHINKQKEDWSVPLPNLPVTWVDMCIEGILLLGHISHTFLCSPTSRHPSTFDPVASFVSTLNIHCDCPPTLLKALADSQPD